MKEKIAIIGSGLMGRGLAIVFTTSGHPVCLYDAFPEALASAKDRVADELALMTEGGLVTAQEAAAALNLLRTDGELPTAVDGVAMVVECVPEKMELKQSVFKALDEICPVSVVLASNTSVMSITEIASTSVNKQRIVGTHFWNPPHLLPLVEVVQTADTAPQTVATTMRILADAGKRPIHVKRDVPGFVANRMQHALWREAFHILDEGIADAKTIDEAVRYSFGLRLPVLAPLENADLIGLDLTLDIHNYILPFLADNKEPSTVLRQHNADGKLGFKTEGNGLRQWSPQDMDASRKNLARYLMEAAVRLKSAE